MRQWQLTSVKNRVKNPDELVSFAARRPCGREVFSDFQHLRVCYLCRKQKIEPICSGFSIGFGERKHDDIVTTTHIFFQQTRLRHQGPLLENQPHWVTPRKRRLKRWKASSANPHIVLSPDSQWAKKNLAGLEGTFEYSKPWEIFYDDPTNPKLVCQSFCLLTRFFFLSKFCFSNRECRKGCTRRGRKVARWDSRMHFCEFFRLFDELARRPLRQC